MKNIQNINDVKTTLDNMKVISDLKDSFTKAGIKENDIKTTLNSMFESIRTFYALDAIQPKLPLDKPAEKKEEPAKPEAKKEEPTPQKSTTEPKPEVKTEPKPVVEQAKPVTPVSTPAPEKPAEIKNEGQNSTSKESSATTDTNKQPEGTVQRKATIAEAYDAVTLYAFNRIKSDDKVRFSHDHFRKELDTMLLNLCPIGEPHAIPDTKDRANSDRKQGRKARNNAINSFEFEVNKMIREEKVKEAAANAKPEETKGKEVTHPAAEGKNNEQKPVVEPSKSPEGADKILDKLASETAKEKTIVAPAQIPDKTLHINITQSGTSDNSSSDPMVALTDAEKAALALPNLKDFKNYLIQELKARGIEKKETYQTAFTWAENLLSLRSEEWVKETYQDEQKVDRPKTFKYVNALVATNFSVAA